MNTGREGIEWMHGKRVWNGYIKRGNGMDIGTEGMQWIHRERVLSGYRERGY